MSVHVVGAETVSTSELANDLKRALYIVRNYWAIKSLFKISAAAFLLAAGESSEDRLWGRKLVDMGGADGGGRCGGRGQTGGG